MQHLSIPIASRPPIPARVVDGFGVIAEQPRIDKPIVRIVIDQDDVPMPREERRLFNSIIDDLWSEMILCIEPHTIADLRSSFSHRQEVHTTIKCGCVRASAGPPSSTCDSSPFRVNTAQLTMCDQHAKLSESFGGLGRIIVTTDHCSDCFCALVGFKFGYGKEFIIVPGLCARHSFPTTENMDELYHHEKDVLLQETIRHLEYLRTEVYHPAAIAFRARGGRNQQ